MTATLSIPCKELGVDHEGSISGATLDELIAHVIETVSTEMSTPVDELSTPERRSLIRSAILQTARPSSRRSVGIAALIA